jgi:OFA family oxalate/formate antiporter-like MFS transporter
VRTKVFWLIYAIYLMIGAGGMIVTAQLGPIAHDFGVDKQVVTLLGFSLPLLTMAISIDNIANGLTRPFSGFLSDKIGRENAMLLMFSAEGVAFLAMSAFGRHPLAFVVFAALIFLFWGEIFSLFPSTLTDTFGSRFASTNYGFLYTSAGIGAILGAPFAALLFQSAGNWTAVFVTAITANFLTAFLAIAVLKPMRRRYMQKGPG